MTMLMAVRQKSKISGRSTLSVSVVAPSTITPIILTIVATLINTPRKYSPVNNRLVLSRQLNNTMANARGNAPNPILTLVMAVAVPRDILNGLVAPTGFDRYRMLIMVNNIPAPDRTNLENQIPIFEPVFIILVLISRLIGFRNVNFCRLLWPLTRQPPLHICDIQKIFGYVIFLKNCLSLSGFV